MREAFELAYANAMLYAKERPLFLSLDEISFKKPIPIGSVLNLTSNVVYTGSTGLFNAEPQIAATSPPPSALNGKECCFQITVCSI